MYTMRKTPRSTFMVGTGDTTTTISASPTYSPVAMMPPVAVIGGAAPTATAPMSPTRNYLMYALVGGAALVAYFMLFRKKEG